MKRKILLLLISLVLLLNVGCRKEKIDMLKSDGGFPMTATNLSFFNSKYDDYNSDLPPGEYDLYPFVFSSNRNSQGKNFDLIYFTIEICYHSDDSTLSIYNPAMYSNIGINVRDILPLINTSSDEYGPYIYPYNFYNDENKDEFLIFYSSNEKGNLDIKFYTSHVNQDKNAKEYYKYDGPYNINLLNTQSNDCYISIINNVIYYCSDRDGDFDIYRMPIDTTVDIVSFLTGNSNRLSEKVEVLNSDKDDKCPFVSENIMVFTSNRDGGIGVFDLYYSIFDGVNWSKPINFGEKVNSEYNEYRPIRKRYHKIINDLMIFSSDRPGGQGGYDLYYIGIDK
jgi:hypothetical protein